MINYFVRDCSENFEFYNKRKDPLCLHYSSIMIIKLMLKYD